MDSNKELFTKIISIVSLVVLGYIFFISVYNQIIVQSGGLFFVIIFGGILILAFVLLSLVTKLIEITKDIKDNFMWNFVEILLLCNFAYLFFAFRLSYQSTVPAEETIIYRAASLMRSGELSDKGMDMFTQLIRYPSQYVYAFVLSIFLKISDNGSRTMMILNAIVLILTAFVIDRVVRKMAGRACGVIAALCTLFIPSQSFAVYSYSGEFFFCLILLLAMDIFLLVLNMEDHEGNKALIYSALLGGVIALLCFAEPLMLIPVIIFAVYYVLRRKAEGGVPKKPIAITAGVAVLFTILFVFVKSVSLNSDIGSVISGSMSRFAVTHNLENDEDYSFKDIFKNFHTNLDNQNTNVNENYHFLVNEDGEEYTQTHNAWFSLGTQMSYMFVIVMSIACSFYMFKNKRRDAIPGLLLMIGCFLVLFFRSSDEASTYFMFEILIIIACCGLFYMYMNHHPELAADDNMQETEMVASSVADKDVNEWGAIARARAIIFAGKNGNQPVYENAQATNMPAGQNVQPAAPSATAPVSGNTHGSSYTEASISPEGYFSFFSMGAPSAPPVPPAPVYNEPAYEEPAQAVTEPEVQYVGPESVSEYEEPSSDYAEPMTEYTEPVYEEPASEYSEPAEEYTEPVYDEAVGEYSEPAEEYTEPVYEEAVSEYSEPEEEYAEPVYEESVSEYSEPAEEYAEPVYEESVSEYSEPAEEYAEPVYEEAVSEYSEPAEEYAEPVYEEAVSEYSEPEEEYAEPVYEEAVSEYNEPADEYAEPVEEYAEPVYEQTYSVSRNRGVNDTGTKKSYGSAAHALGFNLGADFFADMAGMDEPYEGAPEPVYEEAIKQTTPAEASTSEPAYSMADDEEPGFDIFGNEIPYEEEIQQTPADDAHKPYYASEDEEAVQPAAKGYESHDSYDSEVDGYSFGESMPDMFTPEAAVPEPVVPEAIPVPAPAAPPAAEMPVNAAVAPVKKKVIKKKIVRRVVKKAPAPEAAKEAGQVALQANFRQDDALRDIAGDFGQSSGGDDLYYEGYNSGMPELVQENLHELAQANIPVSADEPNINDIIFDEADSRYNLDGLGPVDWDDTGDGDDDGGGASGFVIEI